MSSHQNNNPIDVLIEGSGLMGAFVAHQLRLDGYQVRVRDPNERRSETSHAQGIVHSGFIYSKTPHFADMLFQANQVWRSEFRDLLATTDMFTHYFREENKAEQFFDSWNDWKRGSTTQVTVPDPCSTTEGYFSTVDTGELVTNPMVARKKLIQGCSLGESENIEAKLTIECKGRASAPGSKFQKNRIWTLIGNDSERALSPIFGNFPDMIFDKESKRSASLLVITQECGGVRKYLVQSNLLTGPNSPTDLDGNGKFMTNKGTSNPVQQMVSNMIYTIFGEDSNTEWYGHHTEISLPPESIEVDRKNGARNECFFFDPGGAKLSVYPARLTMAPLLAKEVVKQVKDKIGSPEYGPMDQVVFADCEDECVTWPTKGLKRFVPDIATT